MDVSVALWLFALAAWLVTLVSWNYVDKVKNKFLIIVLGYLLIWIWFILYTIADNIYFLYKFLFEFEKLYILLHLMNYIDLV